MTSIQNHIQSTLSYFAHTKKISLKVCLGPFWLLFHSLLFFYFFFYWRGGIEHMERGEREEKGVSWTWERLFYLSPSGCIWHHVTQGSERSERQRTCSGQAEEANTVLQSALHLLSIFKGIQWGFRNILVLTNAATKFSDISYGEKLGELSARCKSYFLTS